MAHKGKETISNIDNALEYIKKNNALKNQTLAAHSLAPINAAHGNTGQLNNIVSKGHVKTLSK